jgi:predicted acylesterase/phospholipase RssA
VRATRDSELLQTDRSAIEGLYQEAPGFAVAMVHAVASHLRSQGRPEPRAREITVAGVLVDTKHLDADECRRRLIESLGKICTVGELERETEPLARSRALDRCERQQELTVAFADLYSVDEWWHFCTSQTDAVAIVTTPASPVVESLAEVEGATVALVGERHSPAASNWLGHPWVAAALHLGRQPDWPRSYDRLARSMLGASIGLVLSGGGARGFAHIGVLEVLQEAGIDIDRLGGSSMGAFISALYADGASPSEIRRVCRRELVERNPFKDYTLPRASVLRARQAELMLRRVFGSGTLEGTLLPCFTVSCDLVQADVVVHASGPLYWAVGVSMSIPGLVPPAVDGKRILVDGGVLDNLPVDKMARAPGPIIAVDVMGTGWQPRTIPWEVRPGVGGLRGHAALLAGKGPRTVPTLGETLSRTTVIGSWRMAAENRLAADLLIAPEVGDTAVLDFKRLDEMIDIGRAAAEKALPGLLQLVRPRRDL